MLFRYQDRIKIDRNFKYCILNLNCFKYWVIFTCRQSIILLSYRFDQFLINDGIGSGGGTSDDEVVLYNCISVSFHIYIYTYTYIYIYIFVYVYIYIYIYVYVYIYIEYIYIHIYMYTLHKICLLHIFIMVHILFILASSCPISSWLFFRIICSNSFLTISMLTNWNWNSLKLCFTMFRTGL